MTTTHVREPCMCGGCDRCIPGLAYSEWREQLEEEVCLEAKRIGLGDRVELPGSFHYELYPDEVEEALGFEGVVFVAGLRHPDADYGSDWLFFECDRNKVLEMAELSTQWGEWVAAAAYVVRDELPENHRLR
jgi:hypothetical protein